MKNFKIGFTLAEVLITIAVIGIVAAITLPNMITSYQYKTVGTKLSKFASSVEASARAYVISNENFFTSSPGTDDYRNVQNFAKSSFLVVNKDVTRFFIDAFGYQYLDMYKGLKEYSNMTWTYKLKDGTMIAIAAANIQPEVDSYNPSVYGSLSFNIYFDPNVNGLPATAQKIYTFAMTELGYMFPDKRDVCLNAIKNNNWSASPSFFTSKTKNASTGEGMCNRDAS